MKPKPHWLNLIVFFVFFAGYFSMVYSRLVVGKHTVNQILYGSLVGFVTVVYAYTTMRPMLLDHIKAIMDGKEYTKTLGIVIACLTLVSFLATTTIVKTADLDMISYKSAFDSCSERQGLDVDLALDAVWSRNVLL